MNLEKEVDKILRLKRQSSSAKTEAEKRLEKVREEILNGEKTTDEIRDFVIVTCHDISEEIEQPYRKLEEMLKGREGEQVLVVNEHIKKKSKDGCFGVPGHVHVESSLRLGILTSNIIFKINYEEKDSSISSSRDAITMAAFCEPKIILPTKRYAEKCEDEEWELRDKEIQISSSEFNDFNQEGKRTKQGAISFGMYEEEREKLLIRVGSEDVTDYFRSKESFYKEDFSYVKALKLIGIKDQVPEEFVIGYNKEIKEAKEYAFTRLRELVALEKDLIKRTDYNQFQGDKELMDEVAFRLNAPFKELRETTRNIKSTLERAVELRMHNEELEIPDNLLNSQTFVRALCKQYEVPYSKN